MLIRTNGEPDDPRRDFLVRLLGCGFFAAGGLAWRTAAAMGRLPRELPPGKSIYELTGQVLVNGRPAREDMVIRPNDTVVTGPNSRIIFAVGKDAFLVRPNSRIVMEADNSNAIVRNLRLVTGKILSVLGARPARTRSFFRTPTATVGIRGTGLYMEAEPDLSYICTCYGEVRLDCWRESVRRRSRPGWRSSRHPSSPAGRSGWRPATTPVPTKTSPPSITMRRAT